MKEVGRQSFQKRHFKNSFVDLDGCQKIAAAIDPLDGM